MAPAKKSRGAATDDTISWFQLWGAAIERLQTYKLRALAESAHKLLYRFVVCYCFVAGRGAISVLFK
jgi:hypothetical protein